MWLTSVSIRRPVFISMFVLALIILGWQSLNRMPVELYPDIEFPFISVVTVYPGAGPQEIETLVTEPVEEALSSVGNLKELFSTSQDGISIVSMQLELGTSLDATAADVRDKISAARGNLPRDIDEPTILKADISAMPIITIGLYGTQSPRELRHVADNLIRDRLASIGGVAAVNVSGGDVREIAVDVERDRLDAYGITIAQLTNAIRAENITLPSGSIKESTREYAVRAVGEFDSIEQIRDIRISTTGPGGVTSLVRLGDVATVRDTIQEANTLTRLNGDDAVVMAVQKQADANTISVADGVKAALKELEQQLPSGAQVVVATDDSTFVKDALYDVRSALLEGIFLVIVVIFFFLHSGRATFIVAIAIPTSIFATFLPIWAMGMTLNMMTLLGFALVVGILIDDSIVVLENIERHLRMGKHPWRAALEGRSEVGLATVAITLVLVVVFVPIAFMGGIVGQFFRDFGLTVAIATLFSLFVSFTLTPMLASRWMRAYDPSAGELSEDEEPSGNGFVRRTNHMAERLFRHFDRFYQSLDSRYRVILIWALENRALTIVIGVVSLLVVLAMLMPQPSAISPAWAPRLVIAAFAVLLTAVAARRSRSKGIAFGFATLMVIIALGVRFPMGAEMMPEVDQGDLRVIIETAPGSSLQATDVVVKRAEQVLSRVPEMEYFSTTVGSSSAGVWGGQRGSQHARISAQLVDATERQRNVREVVDSVNREMAMIPGADIRVSVGAAMGGGGGQPLQMEIMGSNMDDVVRTAERVQAAIADIPGTADVESSWKVGKPELQVTMDRLRAADLGISVSQAAMAMRAAIEGNTDSKFREGGTEYDIRVRFAHTERQTPADVESIIVGYSNGTPVYLRDVADVELRAAPQSIDRKNRQRLVTVASGIRSGYSLGNVQQQVSRASQDLAVGTAMIGTGGMGEIMHESFGYLIAALILAIVLVYIVMAALFESLATPFIILFSLPQAMVGALLALMLTGKTLSIISMIGIIMLVGLVAKNAILLVDYTNTLRSRGKRVDEAIIEAGPTRLRPILMTTISMIGGVLPTAVALTRGSELRAPMAIAIIGGLTLSMFLTLLVIPAIYSVFADWTGRFRGRLAPTEDTTLPEHELDYASTDPSIHSE